MRVLISAIALVGATRERRILDYGSLGHVRTLRI